LLSRDGPLKQIQQVVLNDREGGERVDWVDTDGHGRNVPGYYVTLPLGRASNAELFPDHTYSMVVKFYQSREAVTLDAEEGLAHPKLCTRYRRSRRDEKVSATPDGLAELKREQDEKLLTLLKAAGLPLRHEFGTYAEDAYFEPTVTDRPLSVTELDLDRVRGSREALVMQYLSDGLSPVEHDALEVLVSKGGKVSPQAIAEETGRHVGSVYRALRRVPGLVERSYGEVALRSREIATLVHESIVEASDRLRETPSGPDDVATRERENREAALFNWLEIYGIELTVREADGSLVFDFGSETYESGEVQRLIRQGPDMWAEAGRVITDYRTATLRYQSAEDDGSNYLPEPDPEVNVVKVWRWLA
jgi:hypothetical protein